MSTIFDDVDRRATLERSWGGHQQPQPQPQQLLPAAGAQVQPSNTVVGPPGGGAAAPCSCRRTPCVCRGESHLRLAGAAAPTPAPQQPHRPRFNHHRGALAMGSDVLVAQLTIEEAQLKCAR